MINCKYADDCINKGILCNTCKHNKNKKKNYYEPDDFIIWDISHPKKSNWITIRTDQGNWHFSNE